MVREPEHDVELWTDEREYAMIPNSELGLTVNPFPLNLADIIDVGGRVVPDFEELADRDTVGMPLSSYQSLTITKDVEDLIEEECFQNISPPPEPLTPEMEFPGLGVGVMEDGC